MWESTYVHLKKMFVEAGYSKPSHVVFWNLRGCTEAFPASANMEGVTMVSGFTPNLVRCFLEDDLAAEEERLAVLRKEHRAAEEAAEAKRNEVMLTAQQERAAAAHLLRVRARAEAVKYR